MGINWNIVQVFLELFSFLKKNMKLDFLSSAAQLYEI